MGVQRPRSRPAPSPPNPHPQPFPKGKGDFDDEDRGDASVFWHYGLTQLEVNIFAEPA